MATRYGEGSIYQDKAKGLFYGTVEVGRGPDGRRLRKKVSGKTKTEVRALLRQVGREVDDGTVEVGPATTTGEWPETWTEDWWPGSAAASTECQYRHVVRDWVTPDAVTWGGARCPSTSIARRGRSRRSSSFGPRTRKPLPGASCSARSRLPCCYGGAACAMRPQLAKHPGGWGQD